MRGMASADELGDNVDWIAGIAERKIQEAIEEGLFDNLPGAGRPLDLTVNPFEPPGMGPVYRMLKHNKVLPSWLLLEREIDAARAIALATLARWEAAEASLRETPHYTPLRDAAREAYERHMRHCNDLILKYNFSNPFAFRSPIPMMIKTRLREFDVRYGQQNTVAS